MSPRGFWARVGVSTAVAVSLALALEPPRPRARVPLAAALALGVVAGTILFLAALRRRPGRARLATGPAAVGKQVFLALCATNEEIIWRRLLLGELMPAGTLAALALSSAGFAVAHRRARCLHTLTGAAFGGLYVVTGTLVAGIAAHWLYNALIDSVLERRPP